MENEQAFLKELQIACLKECEDYLVSFREALANIRERPPESIASIQKILHSMKGNLQAVTYLCFSKLIHSLEDSIEKNLSWIESESNASDLQVLEFFLSSALNAMVDYVEELKVVCTDTDQLYAKRKEPFETLASWVPEREKAKPSEPPAQKEEHAPKTVAGPCADEVLPVSESLSLPTSVSSSLPEEKSVESDPLDESGLYLLFQNSQQYFAISISYIVEVIKSQPLSSLPFKKKNISGLLNLRGEVLPILRMREILASELEKPVYVVVSQIRGLRFGFQVENVHQVVSLDSASFQAVGGVPSLSENTLISHFYQMEDKTISILRLSGFAG